MKFKFVLLTFIFLFFFILLKCDLLFFDKNIIMEITKEVKTDIDDILLNKLDFSVNNIKSDFFVAQSKKIKPDKLFFLLNGYKHGKDIIFSLDLKKLCSMGYYVITADYYSGDLSFKNKTDFIFLKKIATKNQFLFKNFITHFLKEKNIKTKNNVFIGASLGCFIGTKPISEIKDNFSKFAFLYAGSDINSLLNNKNLLKIKNTLLKKITSFILSKILTDFDPGNFSQKLIYKDILMINGKKDNSIPVRNAELLHKSFKNSKTTIYWDEGEHIATQRNDILKKTLDKIYIWLD